MRSIVQHGGEVQADQFRKAYVDFMMTPGSHNDTYASTCHRMFFSNLKVKKLPPEECPDNDQHNVDTIDGLVLPTIASLAISARAAVNNTSGSHAREVAREVAAKIAATTRRSKTLEVTSGIWSDVIYDSMHEPEGEIGIVPSVKNAAKKLGLPVPRDGGRDSMRCVEQYVLLLYFTLYAIP